MVLNAPLERGEQRVRRPTLIYGCERDVTTLGPRLIRGESTPDTPGNGLPRGQTTRIYHRYPGIVAWFLPLPGVPGKSRPLHVR
jgi:hypothetical protein